MATPRARPPPGQPTPTHIHDHRLARTTSCSPIPAVDGPRRLRRPRRATRPGDLGWPPNEHGRRYRHGTPSPTVPAAAAADTARTPSPPTAPPAAPQARTPSHRPRTVRPIPTGTSAAAGSAPRVAQSRRTPPDLGFRVTPHGLRHAHASWLLAGGADLQVVKERLGHASITTTEKYLHTLPTADQSALAALDKMRAPRRRTA